VVLAVDSFGSRGLGPCPNSLHASPPLQAAYRALSQDAWGGLDFLERQPYVAKGKVALVGFSLGANAINSYLVHRPRTGASNFAAVVGIYGRCHDLRRALVPSMPIMQLAGELDERHVGACRQLRPPVEVHVLPGAYHSWDDPSTNGRTNAYGDASRYSPEATRASRELVREFLARRLRN
jgi:dienelactone hydrolase